MHPSPDHDRSPTGGTDDRRSRPTTAAGGSARERRPYPNAPTTTRPSYARPGPRRHQRTVRTSSPSPIPSTVWLCLPDTRGPARTHGFEIWAPETLAAVLAAFTAPLDRVGVLSWPDPIRRAPVRPRTAAPTRPAACVPHDRPGPTSALEVISAAGRIATLLDLCSDTAPAAATTPPGPVDASARIVEPRFEAAQTTSRRSTGAGIGDKPQSGAAQRDRFDLIITGAEPGQVDEDTAQQVALTAARRLRLGGTLVALTHCDHAAGRLVDPGGLLVTAGQSADLLYLQHIVALSTPQSDWHPASDERRPGQRPATDPATPGQVASLGWRPTTHRRAHIDLCVFGQPHDHAADDQLDPDRHDVLFEMGAGQGAAGGLR